MIPPNAQYFQPHPAMAVSVGGNAPNSSSGYDLNRAAAAAAVAHHQLQFYDYHAR